MLPLQHLHPIDLYAGLLPTLLSGALIASSFIYFFTIGYKKPNDHPHEPRIYQYWRFFVSPAVRLLLRLKITPNTVTITSLFITLLASALIATHHIFAAFACSLVAISCDTVDGYMARKLNMSSTAGAFLDSFLDRLSEGALFIGFAVLGKDSHLLWLCFGATISSYAVSYARARGEALGATQVKVGLMERPVRMALVLFSLFFACVLYLFPDPPLNPHHLFSIATGTIAIGGLITALRRAYAIYHELRSPTHA